MQARRLPDGGILVPHGWTDPETGTHFDGMVTVYSGDPLYEAWRKDLDENDDTPTP